MLNGWEVCVQRSGRTEPQDNRAKQSRKNRASGRPTSEDGERSSASSGKSGKDGDWGTDAAHQVSS